MTLSRVRVVTRHFQYVHLFLPLLVSKKKLKGMTIVNLIVSSIRQKKSVIKKCLLLLKIVNRAKITTKKIFLKFHLNKEIVRRFIAKFMVTHLHVNFFYDSLSLIFQNLFLIFQKLFLLTFLEHFLGCNSYIEQLQHSA